MNKTIERIAGLILALAMILGNPSNTQAAGSGTMTSAPTANLRNTQNLDTGADQQLNITKNSINLTTQIPHTIPGSASPALQSTGIGMWISSSEIMSLPTFGAAWDLMRKAAYEAWGTPDL